MPIFVQQRGARHSVRVTHKLLPKPKFFTFDTPEEAYSRGNMLLAVLDRGIVPQELLDEPKGVALPLLFTVIKEYEVDPNMRVANSDKETLSLLMNETPGLRMNQITFEWANELINGYKKEKKAPGTIRKRIGALSRVLDWYSRKTVVDGKVTFNNILKMLPKGYSQYADGSVRDEERNRRLVGDELDRLRAAARGMKLEGKQRQLEADPAMELMLDLAVDTGLRLKEMYTLKVSDLALDQALIHLNGSKGHHGALKPRTVPLKREIREKLRAWCEGKSGLVFPYWNGTEEDMKNCQLRIGSKFSTLCSYAKIKDLTMHDLRHEACCRWVSLKGASGWMFNELEICKIMGWTDIRMMMRYASLRGEDLSARLL